MSVDTNDGREAPGDDWRRQRRAGIGAIGSALLVALAVWLGLRFIAPPLAGMEDGGERLIFAFKWICVATLFTLVMGVEAVAHERLQSAAFDPLAGRMTRRLAVNQRYLQNTLEQIVVFAVGLLGLAWYSSDGSAMRAVSATSIVWILSRFAFWIGYHRSAALRGLGAPGVLLSLLVLLYVVGRIGFDWAGWPGVIFMVVSFFAIEAVLFRTTATRS